MDTYMDFPVMMWTLKLKTTEVNLLKKIEGRNLILQKGICQNLKVVFDLQKLIILFTNNPIDYFFKIIIV